MAPRTPSAQLVQAFFAWKLLLCIVASFSPGPGYDTSALIALNPSSSRHIDFQRGSTANHVAIKFFRWDALYFVKSAQRGYLFEQEWAFSWAYSLVLNAFVKLAPGFDSTSLNSFIWAGIFISNTCHLISVLVIYRLTNVLLGRQQNGRIPFVASILHIVSPAGMFLSSPYAESTFAALNFGGMLLYAKARLADRVSQRHKVGEDNLIIAAGALFTLATWMRSNGLLSGLLFLFDAVSCVPRLLRMQLSTSDMRRLVVTCLSGIILGIGSMIPQYVAYQQYCVSETNASARTWCSKTVPSIYTWVQSHYWNVGFLRYWTLSNIPLFVLAGPILWLLLQTGFEHLRCYNQKTPKPFHPQLRNDEAGNKGSSMALAILPQLALPQLVLAITAATNFHVQVINRLSSGYPVWYVVIAGWTITRDSTPRKEKLSEASEWICRGLMMYTIIQGALFASFLPPA